MLQKSKLILSREAWRVKAVKRGLELKELKKTLAQRRQKIAELKSQLNANQQAAADIKKR